MKRISFVLAFSFCLIGSLTDCSSNTSKITITWQNYDGTVLKVDEDVKRGSMPVYDGPTPEREKTQKDFYTFNGWEPTITIAQVSQVYRAKFKETLNKYDVIFNSDGGSYTPETQSIDYGGYAIKQDLPSKYGFDCTGWYVPGDSEPFDFVNTQITDTIELTARYVTATYDVRFHSNCGQDSSLYNIEHGQYIQPPSITYTGNILEGWYESPTFTDKKFDFNNTQITKDLDLYAKWVLKDCTVTFNAGTDAIITGTDKSSYTTPSFKYGKTWDEINDKTATKTGYTFQHWSLENSQTGKPVPSMHKPEGNEDVYAVYKKNKYKITFVPRGGNAIEEQEIEYLGYADEPTPVYGTHTFLGWYESETYQGEAFKFTTTPITSNLTLYAKWDSYDILFDGNGGYFDDTKTTTSKTVVVNCGDLPTISNPKRDSTLQTDYTFNGWDKELGAVYEPNTYQAQWESSDRDYTFEFNGTNCSADGYSSIYHYNDNITFTITPISGDYVLSKTISVLVNGEETATDKYSYNYISGAFSMKCIGNISITVTASQDTNCTTLSYTRSGDDYDTIKFAYEGTLDHVNWGDGTYDTSNSHTFSENKDYTIYIFGNLTSIDFHKGTSTLAKGNQKITAIKLSSTINHFAKGDIWSSFAFMYGLTSITLSNSIEDTDARGVFGHDNNLTSVTLPINEKFTRINGAYFANCSKLKEVVVSNYITVFDNMSFENCKKLDTINFPSNLTTIGDNAFYQCVALSKPTLPDTLTEIGQLAFAHCSSFTGSLTIPSNVTTVGAQAFANCDNLTSINVPFKEGEKPAGWKNNWNEHYNGIVNYLE